MAYHLHQFGLPSLARLASARRMLLVVPAFWVCACGRIGFDLLPPIQGTADWGDGDTPQTPDGGLAAGGDASSTTSSSGTESPTSDPVTEEPSVAVPQLVWESTAALEPAVGDGSGTPYTLDCGSGGVAIGFYGRAGALVDAVGLICGRLGLEEIDPQQYRATVLQEANTPLAGGTGGDPYEVRCPIGAVMVGMSGRAVI